MMVEIEQGALTDGPGLPVRFLPPLHLKKITGQRYYADQACKPDDKSPKGLIGKFTEKMM
jgi:hypothetical protein